MRISRLYSLITLASLPRSRSAPLQTALRPVALYLSFSSLVIAGLALTFIQTADARTQINSAATASSSPTIVRQEDNSKLPSLSSVERELKGGETQSYRISLNRGQFLSALVEQRGIDVVVTLFGPDGKQLAETDSPNDRWGTEPILLVATAPGDYRV